MEEKQNEKVIKMSRSVFDKNFDQAKIMRELEEKKNNDVLPINLPPIQEKEEIILPSAPDNEVETINKLPSQNKNNNLKNILPLLIFLIFRCRGNNR
ncbi:MAG: hypothetical protein IJ008_00730 [Clostridia bacterium]|nr:hypothetical protein [Clostridia bacterium]